MSTATLADVRVAVFLALREEQRFLVPRLKRRTTVRQAGQRGFVGELDGVRVSVWRTGVGRARAAHVSRAVLRGSVPGHVVVTGFAGGLAPGWTAGDVILASRVTAAPEDESDAVRQCVKATLIYIHKVAFFSALACAWVAASLSDNPCKDEGEVPGG